MTTGEPVGLHLKAVLQTHQQLHVRVLQWRMPASVARGLHLSIGDRAERRGRKEAELALGRGLAV
jgi:hypothetical protein